MFDESDDDGFGSVSTESRLQDGVDHHNAVVASAIVPCVSPTLALDIQHQNRILSRQHSVFVMPWERGAVAKVLCKAAPIIPINPFCMPPLPRVILPASPALQPFNVKPVTIKRPVVPFVLRKLRQIDVPDLKDQKRNQAINRWRMIIEYNLSASAVGLQISEMIEDGRDDCLVLSTLLDTFASKKVSTMNKRAASMLRYFRWARVKSSGVEDLMEFRESDVYRYVNYLRDAKASPSAAKSFKEALNFAMHVLGIPNIQAAVSSSRIKGAATNQLSKKRKLKQAPAYKVPQIRIIHHVLESKLRYSYPR